MQTTSRNGYLQKVYVEQRGYVKVHDLSKITENNLIDKYFGNKDLLEKIISKTK